MNTTMSWGRTNWLAASLALAITLLSFGGQLTLAEHYARAGAAAAAADMAAGNAETQAMRVATRKTCPGPDQQAARALPSRPDQADSRIDKTA